MPVFFPSSASTLVTRIRFLSRPFCPCFIHICNAAAFFDVAVAEGVRSVYGLEIDSLVKVQVVKKIGLVGKWGVGSDSRYIFKGPVDGTAAAYKLFQAFGPWD